MVDTILNHPLAEVDHQSRLESGQSQICEQLSFKNVIVPGHGFGVYNTICSTIRSILKCLESLRPL
jgi:hypothetical protein